MNRLAKIHYPRIGLMMNKSLHLNLEQLDTVDLCGAHKDNDSITIIIKTKQKVPYHY